MPTYALKHEGLSIIGEVLRLGGEWKRKRDGQLMLSFTVKVDGEDVPVKHEVSVPVTRFDGKPSEGAQVYLTGTAGEYNGSAYFQGYSGAVLSQGEIDALSNLNGTAT
jgi:hypothetical protein